METFNAEKPLILCAPPGAGKTMLAPRLARDKNHHERLRRCEVDLEYIHRMAGGKPPVDEYQNVLVPFRAPHYTASILGMTGQLVRGFYPRPGELSLAHGGTLFLDQADEFSLQVIINVRAAFSQKFVRLEHPKGVVSVPAEFGLILATEERQLPRMLREFPDAVVWDEEKVRAQVALRFKEEGNAC